LVAALLLAGAARAEGVREARPWIVNAELLGRAGLASVNVERYFNQYVGVGVGIGFLPCFDSGICDGNVTMVPVYLSVNPLGDVHSLYLSVGVASGFDSSSTFAVGVAQVGYQMQLRGGFFLRPTVQVYFKHGSEAVGLDYFPWAGLALGYSF
jgi:hypothetical protein